MFSISKILHILGTFLTCSYIGYLALSDAQNLKWTRALEKLSVTQLLKIYPPPFMKLEDNITLFRNPPLVLV